MKEYLQLQGNASHATHLKVETYYHLGGQNWFTGKIESRGYYLSVSPVEYKREGGMISEGYTAFSGLKVLVKEVARKSAKAEAEANKTAEQIKNYYIDKVCEKNGLKLV